MQSNIGTLENSSEFFSEGKDTIPYDSAIPLLGLSQNEMKTHIYTKTCLQMFTTVLFLNFCPMITPNWKKLQGPSTGK